MDTTGKSKSTANLINLLTRRSAISLPRFKPSQNTGLNNIPITKLLILTGKPISSEENFLLNSYCFSDETKLNITLRKESRKDNIKNLEKILEHLNDPDEQLRNKHEKYIIFESNRKKYVFDILITILNLYSVLTTLYFLSFSHQNQYELILDQIVRAFFIVDFILNFFTEREDYHGQKIRNFKLIAAYYAKRWMIFDFLAFFPFSWLNNPNTEYGLRLTRIFKLGRLLDMVNINFLSNEFSKLVSDGQGKERKYIKILLLNSWDLFRALVAMIFASYFLTCLWYFYIDLIERRFNEPTDFFTSFKIFNDSPRSRLIKIWYFIFTTLTTTGYGDLYATNKYEMLLCIVICIVGATWFAFTGTKVLNIVKNLQDLASVSNKSADLAVWLSSIEKKQKRIPYEVKERINNFFLYYWRNNRLGSIANVDFESEVLEKRDPYFFSMPESLRLKVVEFLFHDILYVFSYFFGRSNDWKYDACLYLQPRIFVNAQTILDFNEEVQEIFFTMSGEFEILLMVNGQQHRVYSQDKKSIIGDYCVYKGIKSFLKYQALETIHTFAIPSHVLKKSICMDKEHFRLYFQVVAKNLEGLVETFPKTSENEITEIQSNYDHCNVDISASQENEIRAPEEEFKSMIKRINMTRINIIKLLKEKLINMCRNRIQE